jgi:hypothetical protein
VNVARLDRGHDSRANDFVVPLALQLRTLTAFDGLLIIPRPTQSFVISLSRNLSGASHFLADIKIGSSKIGVHPLPRSKNGGKEKGCRGRFPRQPWLTQPNRRLDVHLVRERGAPEHVVEGHRSELGMQAAACETRVMNSNALIECGRMGGGVERA